MYFGSTLWYIIWTTLCTYLCTYKKEINTIIELLRPCCLSLFSLITWRHHVRTLQKKLFWLSRTFPNELCIHFHMWQWRCWRLYTKGGMDILLCRTSYRISIVRCLQFSLWSSSLRVKLSTISRPLIALAHTQVSSIHRFDMTEKITVERSEQIKVTDNIPTTHTLRRFNSKDLLCECLFSKTTNVSWK